MTASGKDRTGPANVHAPGAVADEDVVSVPERPDTASIAVHDRELEVRPSAFPRIDDYAFLSDLEVTALLAPNGSVEWMCLPRSDGPSIFAAILDRTAGSFRIGPADVMVPLARRYLPGTMVLETTWQTRTGWLVVRDTLAVIPWYSTDRLEHYRRPPGDAEAEQCLVRTVECVEGKVDVTLSCEPVFDYGRLAAGWEYDVSGYGSAVTHGPDGSPSMHLITNMRLDFEGAGALAYRTMQKGDTAFAALSWSDDPPPPKTFQEADDRITRTGEYWRTWLDHGDFPDHPWRSYLERSALTLKGLTYAPTGALLAACTTSLPETPQGQRNWDYRYSWIRDATFALWALYTLGFDHEANDFFNFMADVAEAGELQPMYGLGGERDLEESTLDHLSGYEGAKPIRIGNHAYQQNQHDVWGTILDSVYVHAKSRDQLPKRVWSLLAKSVDRAIEKWQEPDRGIWEIRGEPKHFTSSKLMCWVACDRGAHLAVMHEDYDLAARWQGAGEEIHADICANGLDERGVFVQHYDTTALDASLLLMPLVRFLPPDDPRIRATVLAIADELTEKDLVLRYKVHETDDGLSGEEGSFTICSFWLVSALVQIGEVGRARRLCENLLSFASPLLLYAEEIDPRSGRHLGNFPQAFTHLALINAVMHVIDAEG
ncbi:MAG TPA: glycoside hydrolase family 15 protein [Actinomycetota bacterium]|nr:glycoside hydrolase family 15 protein [Actinomycetota bacterium]